MLLGELINKRSVITKSHISCLLQCKVAHVSYNFYLCFWNGCLDFTGHGESNYWLPKKQEEWIYCLCEYPWLTEFL